MMRIMIMMPGFIDDFIEGFSWVPHYYTQTIPDTSQGRCPATSGAQYMAVPMRAVRRRCKPEAIGDMATAWGHPIRTR